MKFSSRFNPETSSCIVKVSHTAPANPAAAAVTVVGDQHFSVLIGPETVEVNQDADHCVALTAVHQVLQCDLEGVFRLHHVKDLILKRELNVQKHRPQPLRPHKVLFVCMYLYILEGDRLLSVQLDLFLNGLKRKKKNAEK